MGTGESGNYYTSGGSSVVHHAALIHSIDGDYTHNQNTGRLERMRSGGHGQASMDIMAKNGISYNVTKTYENGVRVGNVPDHKDKRKRAGAAQVWFPQSWSTQDIVKAGEHVASLKTNRHASDGEVMWGMYKGVRVGAIKTNGKVATVFPDEIQPNSVKKRRKR